MNRNLTVALSAVVFALSLEAASPAYWQSGGTGGFTDPSHWRDGNVPQAGWQVRFDGTTDAVVTDADMDLFKSFGSVVLAGTATGTRLTISNETAATISVNNGTYFFVSDGKVFKRGKGTLTLAHGSNSAMVSLYGGFEVYDGTLELTASDGTAVMPSCPVGVFAPGVISMPTNVHTKFKGLYGDGIVSNAQASLTQNLYITSGSRAAPWEFYGTFAGNVKYYGENNGYQRFLNPDLVIGGNLYKGYLGTAAFPDAILRENCEYEYLGAGETAGTGSELFYMNNGAFCLTMNGGTNGALVLNKKIYYNANDTYVGEVIWTGDNEYPCEYAAGFTVTGDRPVYWKKTGKGTWKFTTSTARDNAGVVATEKGRIEYDSIAEKGGASALGTSGWLLSEYYGSAVDDSKSVPYAYLLGDGTNTVDADTATMKYIGADAKTITTRPVALKGAGRFSSAAAALEWTGFTSAQAGGNTLVLAGEAAGCAALAVTNGAGTLSVVKEGAGDWTIKGDYDFSGGAVSQGGTLTLAGNNYTWYRLSLMQNYGDYDKGDTGTPLKDRPNCDGNNIWLSQFGLFDAAGSNLIVDLTHNTAANGDTAALQPGQTALGSSDFVQMGSGDAYALTNLFNSAQTPFGGRRNVYPPVPDNEATWIKVTVRLPADSTTPTRYDIRSYGKYSYDPFLVRDVRSWKIEGSLDGIAWDELDTVVSNEAHAVDAQYDWYSSDTPNYTTGYGIGTASALLRPAALAYVSVSDGGTVISENSLTANGLKIDCGAGGGTIEGFAFAASSTVEIVNAPNNGQVLQLPVTFLNCSGLDEIAGSLTVNGKDKDIKLLRMVDGKLYLYPVGMCIRIH